jgi:hypothetical protein
MDRYPKMTPVLQRMICEVEIAVTFGEISKYC